MGIQSRKIRSQLTEACDGMVIYLWVMGLEARRQAGGKGNGREGRYEKERQVMQPEIIERRRAEGHEQCHLKILSFVPRNRML
jgi:hypothetical protein